MSSLAKRGNKWYIRYRRPNGKPTFEATGCDIADRVGAEIKLWQWERDQELGRIDPLHQHRKQSLTDHISDYHAHQVATGVTQKQAGEVRRRIIRVFEVAGIKRIEDVSESKIQVTVSGLRALPRTKKKTEADMPLLSPRSRNMHRKAVYAFARWMYRDNRVEREPLRRLKMESEEIDIRHARTALTDQQFVMLYSTTMASTKIIEGYDGPTRARMYLISVMTGLRRTELGSLTRRRFAFGKDPLSRCRPHSASIASETSSDSRNRS